MSSFLITLVLMITATSKNLNAISEDEAKLSALFNVYMKVTSDSMLSDIRASQRARKQILAIAPESKSSL